MCVRGGSSTTTTQPPPTATSSCTQMYTVDSGDTCFKIWTQFGITEAQLRAWNPNLDANCDIFVGEVLL